MKRLILTVVLLTGFSLLYAADISDIRISGLKRTSETKLRNKLSVEIGDPFRDDTVERIRINLARTELFSSIEIRTEELPEEQIAILIELEEKWTLIPLPFFSVQEGEISAGLFMLDSNFFGSMQTFTAGYSYIRGDHLGLLSFSLAPAGDSRISPRFMTAVSSSEDIFNSLSFGGTLGIEINDDIQLSPGLSLTLAEEDFKPYISIPITFELNKTRPQEYFSPGITLDLSLSPGSAFSLKPFGIESSLRIKGSWVPSERHQFSFYISGKYDSVPAFMIQGLGGFRGSRLLGESAPEVDLSLSGDLEYQWAFWSTGSFFTSLLFFAESGIYRDFKGDGLNIHGGAGGGFRLYLKRIALPALGLDGGYSFSRKTGVLNISLGFSI